MKAARDHVCDAGPFCMMVSGGYLDGGLLPRPPPDGLPLVLGALDGPPLLPPAPPPLLPPPPPPPLPPPDELPINALS
jgi:hypothetical protein